MHRYLRGTELDDVRGATKHKTKGCFNILPT